MSGYPMSDSWYLVTITVGSQVWFTAAACCMTLNWVGQSSGCRSACVRGWGVVGLLFECSYCMLACCRLCWLCLQLVWIYMRYMVFLGSIYIPGVELCWSKLWLLLYLWNRMSYLSSVWIYVWYPAYYQLVPTAGGCIVIQRYKWAIILEIYCA
jgi:hypothetical protein